MSAKEYSPSLKTAKRCMINCSSLKSDKCVKRLEAGIQGIRENIKRNGGKYICRPCATFLRSERNIKIQTEEKKKFVDSRLEDILEARKTKPLSGETKICPNKRHDIYVRNCIPRYPYSKSDVPVEDFYNKRNPDKPSKLCLGCRTYASQSLTIRNTKIEADTDIPDCKTCLSGYHSLVSTMPRENIPIQYFLKDPNDPNSKICKKCSDCRNHTRNLEEKRISKILANGDICCFDCKVKKTIEEMGVNKDGTVTKCKNCKQREVDYELKRNDDLMNHLRQLQLDRIIERECSCEVCKCIFIKPDEGKFVCTKLQTRIEDEKNVIDYEGQTYFVKDFLLNYSHLLEYRILDFDHLPTTDPSMKKLYSVSKAKTKEKMTVESTKCQLVDCECHLKETIKREKGYQHYGERSRKKEYVDNIKRSGCSFCSYTAENTEMLRFIHMDHIDPATKTAGISRMVYGDKYAMDNLYEETPKCRPLCSFCHRIFTHYFYGSSYIECYNSIDPIEIIENYC